MIKHIQEQTCWYDNQTRTMYYFSEILKQNHEEIVSYVNNTDEIVTLKKHVLSQIMDDQAQYHYARLSFSSFHRNYLELYFGDKVSTSDHGHYFYFSSLENHILLYNKEENVLLLHEKTEPLFLIQVPEK